MQTTSRYVEQAIVYISLEIKQEDIGIINIYLSNGYLAFRLNEITEGATVSQKKEEDSQLIQRLVAKGDSLKKLEVAGR